MVVSGPTAPGRTTSRRGPRDHRFHRLRIARVVRETADARSFVVDVPPELRSAFAYRAGQFCTFRVTVDGRAHLRCYSMSSSPATDPELQVTVKRVARGVVSNWVIDTLRAGDVVEATVPAGVFCLEPGDRDVLAFAAGSGITPVISLVKTALATSSRRVRLLYANQDWEAVIFRSDLDALVDRYPDRLEVIHRLDAEHGFVDAATVRAFATGHAGDDVYLCGPTPFMDVVEQSLLAAGVESARIHVERFSPAELPADDSGDGAAPSRVTVEIGGRVDTTSHHPGTTILQAARQMGLAAPSSCESGTCATCMARLVEGAVEMRANNALTDDEVAQGWVLTCQSVPTTPTVRVVYGYE
jgi:3-ketosteroid 9alpha-monooxygenase subunit B